MGVTPRNVNFLFPRLKKRSFMIFLPSFMIFNDIINKRINIINNNTNSDVLVKYLVQSLILI